MKRILLMGAVVLAFVAGEVGAQEIQKADNTISLDQGTSWVGNTAPGSGNIASWYTNATVTSYSSSSSTGTVGASVSWQGIKVGSLNANLVLAGTAGGGTISLGSSGIDMSGATKNLNITTNIQLVAPQTWTVAGSRLLKVGNVTNSGHTITIDVSLPQYTGENPQVNLNFNGILSGSGGLIKNGSGTVFMGNVAHTYTGNVVLNTGMLNAGAQATALGSGASALTLAGGTLTFAASSAKDYGRPTTISGNVFIRNNNSANNGAQNYSFGSLSIGSFVVTVDAMGSNTGMVSFATTTLSGNPTFAITNRIDNRLMLSAVGDAGAGYGITKTGEGTLILTNACTYSGATVVSNGVLELANHANTSINPASILNVASNGTLRDAYATGRNLTNSVLRGAGTFLAGSAASYFVVTNTLAPGDSGVGTLNVATGCVQMAAGSTFTLEMTGSAASPTNDMVNLSGPNSAVSFGGAWTLNIKSYTAFDPAGMTNVLFDYTGADPSLVQPTITFDSGTKWAGGQVSVDSANTRIILTGLRLKRAGSLISVW